MGFKEKLAGHYTKTYFKKYGDRLAQVQGTVISVKIEEKTILWIFHKLTASIIVRPDRSKNVVKCALKKKKWFKKPNMIAVSQGHQVIIQGLKGKKGKENREVIEIMNIRNLTTKKDLVQTDQPQPKQVVKYKR